MFDNMDIPQSFYYARNFVLTILVIIIYFGAFYGLFVSEISMKLGAENQYHFLIKGWLKNSICLGIIFSPGIIIGGVIVSSVYRALVNGNS